MRRAQFSLKTLLWLMAIAAAFCFGFVAGGGRERQQLEAQRRRLVDEAYDLSVRQTTGLCPAALARSNGQHEPVSIRLENALGGCAGAATRRLLDLSVQAGGKRSP